MSRIPTLEKTSLHYGLEEPWARYGGCETWCKGRRNDLALALLGQLLAWHVAWLWMEIVLFP
jgi:hypothetical protein